MVKTVIMSAEQSEVYEHGDDQQVRQILANLWAASLAIRKGSETMEIQTVDGIVVEVIQD